MTYVITTPDTPELRQRQFIDRARDLLQPSPVRQGMPNWFRKALLRTYSWAGQYGFSGHAVLDMVRTRLPLEWIDHHGRTTWFGADAFVSEPYEMTAATLQSVADLAAAIGCRYAVTPNSWWFPGNTWRIVLFRRDDLQEGGNDA